jgi:hypothetical protein
MAFPGIRACLVCQDVRVEQGKLSVRGLFGLLPDVQIHFPAQHWATPLRLMFLMSSGPGSGIYSARPTIFGPDGSEVIPGCPLKLSFEDGRISHFFFADFGRVRFLLQGKYSFALFVEEEEEEVFRDTFSVVADGWPAEQISSNEPPMSGK